MSVSGALVIIACNEAIPLIDPARHFNLNNGTTRVIKTAGGRTEGAVNSIYHINQSGKIGMIVVVQHTGCAWLSGEVECSIRADIQALKASTYVPTDVPIIGYVLDLTTGQLREVKEEMVSVERVETGSTKVDSKDEGVIVETRASEDLPFSKARCIALVTTLVSVQVLYAVSSQSSVIVLPSIGRDLQIPISRQQWVISSFNLTFGCFLLLCGRLADVYGRKQVFLLGLSVFTVTNIAAPFVRNEIGFDTLRGLQGLGASAIAPTALGILGSTFPPGKAKDVAFGCYGAGLPLGGIIGHVFGGIVCEYLSWRWIYWMIGIIAAMSTIASYYIIPGPLTSPQLNRNNTVDWTGGTLITVGLIILIFALSQGNIVGWQTPWIPTLIALSLLIVLGFGYWQHYLETKTEKRPLMKMSLFKHQKIIAVNVLIALVFSSFSNFLIFATYWFQEYQGLSVIQTTLRFLPAGITGIVMALVTGYIMSRVPAEYILLFSTISVGISSLLFAIPIPVNTSYWAYGFPAMILCVGGTDTMYPVLTLFVAKTLPPEDASLGGGLVTASNQICRAIALAVATALQTALVAREKGVPIEQLGNQGQALEPWDDALKVGIRSASWFNFALSMTAMIVVIVFVRGIGVVGGKGPRKS
ncbi:hypothetical protein yc1106_08905 [Curvularia clavata]|uniref:Major facilitator superfamily (MFS) profile domain-containing protein n=1 Tax=Curvularia clavata TaxID=95742 RepID=A0A9Q8ZGF4_CURCL|nr:hypothetical protein yc1106_08905 [Curvularia clavata]